MIEPVLIGSYKRHVSIRRVKDVDVFCRLEELPEDETPEALLERLEEVLTEKYGAERVTKQARSVQVAFPEFDGLYVDAVPACPVDGVWEIPQHESNDWQRTNPEELTSLSSSMNDKHDDLYVPTVKLLRQTRRTLLGRRPGGLFIELALYNACDRGLVCGRNQAEFYTSALEGAAALIAEHASGDHMPDPTLSGKTMQIRATDAELQRAKTEFQAAAAKARDAYETDDRCAAAFTFRQLLGGNDDHEFVFPMPEDRTDDGQKKASAAPIVAGDRTVPAGNRRYG
jgi:Second Messenger Oligonucleotide or Dinucleotide Synthetase domain